MDYIVTAEILTGMLIPTCIAFLALSIQERKKEYISVFLLNLIIILTGISVIVNEVFLLEKYNNLQNAIFWNMITSCLIISLFPAINFFFNVIFDIDGFLKKIQRTLLFIGIALTIIALILIHIKPSIFRNISFIEQYPHSLRDMYFTLSTPGLILFFLLTLNLVFGFSISVLYIIKNLKKTERKGYQKSVAIGLTIALFPIISSFHKIFFNTYWDPFAEYNFSRLLVSLNIIAVTSLYSISQKLAHNSNLLEKSKQVLKENQKNLELLAFQDKLTNMCNRQAFLRDLVQSKIKNQILLLVDIDNMTFINTFYGYSTGDKVLKQIYPLSQHYLPPQTLGYRLESDNFAFLLNTSFEESENHAIQFLAAIQKTTIDDKKNLQITASMGIAKKDETINWEELINRSNAVLNQAKQVGNTVQCFDPIFHEREKRRQSIIADLTTALAHNQLYVVYQPIVCIHNNLIGVEALIRWEHPQFGTISPVEFIPIAESVGLISKITAFVIKQSGQDFLPLFQKYSTLQVHINLSGQDIANPNLLTMIEKNLCKNCKNPHFFSFEVTETSLISDWNMSVQNIAALRSKGFSFALDDFGTGYSSLGYLNELPLDKLKIDRSFIQNAVHDKKKTILLDTIIKLGENLNLDVIIEGVENSEQIEFLTSRNCIYFQGFYYSKPLKINEFINWATTYFSLLG